jgi:hypothetical protein
MTRHAIGIVKMRAHALAVIGSPHSCGVRRVLSTRRTVMVYDVDIRSRRNRDNRSNWEKFRRRNRTTHHEARRVKRHAL